MKSMVICFLLSLGCAFSAQASEAPRCADWPQLVGVTTPSMTVTDHPFNLTLRFDCLLQADFQIETLMNGFQQQNIEIRHSVGPIVVPVSEGRILYQFLFVVPGQEPGGFYQLKSCVRVKRLADGQMRCYPVERQIEVVRRLN